MIWEKRKFWLDLYGRFARRVFPKRSSTVLRPELFVCVFFLYQTFTMSTIWWTWKSASNVSRLQKNASVSVRTKCNISQSRWMSFLKVCVHYYVFYEGILYNISMICFRKNVHFFLAICNMKNISNCMHCSSTTCWRINNISTI